MIGAHVEAEIGEGKRIDWVAPSLEPLVGMLARLMKGWPIEVILDELKGRALNVVDVGACVGSWGIIMAMNYPSINMTCIEANKSTYDCLVHNAKGMSNVQTINAAVDNKHGTIKLSLPNLKDWNTEHKPIELYKNYGLMTAYGSGRYEIEVECHPLDDLVDKVDFLKIDIEGMEMRLLEGAQRIMTEECPIIQIEMSERNQVRAGHTTKELDAYIRDFGYAQLRGSGEADNIYFPRKGRSFA